MRIRLPDGGRTRTAFRIVTFLVAAVGSGRKRFFCCLVRVSSFVFQYDFLPRSFLSIGSFCGGESVGDEFRYCWLA